MQSASRSDYLPWVDVTRIFAIFLVIVIHVSYTLVLKWDSLPFNWWMVGNLADGPSHVAIPLFIMVSGYLNLSHPLPWRDYLKKRVSRILILLVTWSLIHMFLLAFVGQQDYTLLSALKAILTGSAYDHLWFMYALLGFYLITPVFQKIIELDRPAIWYFMILWLIFEPFASLLDRLTGIQFGTLLPQATGLFGYYLLGYLLGTREFTKKQSWLAFGVALLSILAVILGTWALTVSAGQVDLTLYNINGFPILFGAVGLFIFIKSISFNNPLVRFFGTTTTGIYLMHYIIIELVKRGVFGMKLSALHPNPYVGIPAASVIVFLLSALITWILLRIPILRRTVS
jgi:surface polysaccharide O-acyltransferase-like enzyme